MRQRLRFEAEIRDLQTDVLPAAEQWSSIMKQTVASAKARVASVQPPDFDTAKNVVWDVIRIVNRQYDVTSGDPDRWTSGPAWRNQYKPLLKEWFIVIHGEPAGTGRAILKGKSLLIKLESAITMTQPLLDVLKSKGGNEWKKNLRTYFYSPIADLEAEGAESEPKQVNVAIQEPVEFSDRPKAVSIEQFFSHVSKSPHKPIEIRRGHNYSLGQATVGTVFSTSQQEQRMLLWSAPGAVFYMRDGQIFAQSARSFSEDIIMGAFVLAAQNAVGSVIMAQLMVEIAMSFTPWGFVWDGMFAIKALTEGNWKEAALTILPGPSISLASRLRPVRAIARGVGIGANVGIEVAKRTVSFIGRGAYRLGDKLLRGVWIVGESAKTGKTYRFFDDVAKTWHQVPSTTAQRYIRCSTCNFTAAGKSSAVQGEVAEILDDLRLVPAYAPGGRLLIDPKLVEDVIKVYGAWGDHVIEMVNRFASRTNDAVKVFNDTLRVAKDLGKIRGSVDLFEDLASSSVYTAQGAIYELRWAAKHADEIREVGLPVTRKNWVGKGLDVLKKNGEAVELKNYDFTNELYRMDPERAVARVVKQVRSRLKYKDISKVTVIFSSEGGKMPVLFRQQLSSAFAELERVRKSAKVSFKFWP